MAPDDDRSGEYDDPRVAAALREYMAGKESGRPIARGDLLERYSEVADEVAECLEGLEFLQTAAAELQREPTPRRAAMPDDGQWSTRPLGDFQILHQIGNGGMGVVYEAIQLSLGRRVAVKVLPFAAALDPTQLQRFKNEAQAAAQLHHSNIVPVYAVGCERGIHYYAMQLIEGKSLAAVIGELRKSERTATPDADTGSWSRFDAQAPASSTDGGGAPTQRASAAGDELSRERAAGRSGFYRTAVRLIAQAADALEYAHQMGIVHRDVKPANLLIDYRGNLWITDFGLAHIQAGAALTATNRVVGTLPYMSPEQLGKGVLLDHRTDVYSLGVTLYELLTLHPAFSEADLQHLQRLVQNEDPPSPRKYDPSLPYDLETVVLKATAKSPSDRYQSAREFAGDLQRFLLDQPILAKRPTVMELATRWMRRHRRFVIAGVVFLALSTVLLAASTALVARANARTAAAYRQAKLKAEEAERERAHAEENLLKARRAVDAFAQLTTTPSPGPPNFGEMRRRMLEIALDYYQELLQEAAGDSALQAELAPTRELVAKLLRESQEFEGSSQGMRVVMLLESTDTRQDLATTPEQIERIDDVLETFHTAPRELFSPTSKESVEQRKGKFQKRSEKTKEELLRILTVTQNQRVQQMLLQMRGSRCLVEPDVAAAVGLSDAQVGRLRVLFEAQTQQKWNEMIRAGKSPEAERPGPPASPLADPAVRAVLTPAQQAHFEQMIGRPFSGRPGPPPRPR